MLYTILRQSCNGTYKDTASPAVCSLFQHIFVATMAELDQAELERYSLNDIVMPAAQLPATAATGGRPPSYRSILRSSYDRGKYELLHSLSTRKSGKEISDEQHEIAGWPRRPQQLKTLHNRVKHALLDLFMAGVALLWLVYGAYVYNLNGSPAHETETQLVEAGRIVSSR